MWHCFGGLVIGSNLSERNQFILNLLRRKRVIENIHQISDLHQIFPFIVILFSIFAFGDGGERKGEERE